VHLCAPKVLYIFEDQRRNYATVLASSTFTLAVHLVFYKRN